MGSISGSVYIDNNANGIKDAGDAGFNGVGVELTDALGNIVDFLHSTDANGHYSFSGLADGTYTLTVLLPPDYIFSPLNVSGDPLLDNDAGTTGIISNLVISPASQNLDGENSAMYQPASIGDFVFDDANVNGRQDAGEAGIAGVTVNLLNTAGTVLATTTTDGTGHYLFSNLTPGDYKVGFVTPTGYKLTRSDMVVATDLTDSDANPATGVTGTYTLTSGANNSTVDAGMYITPVIANLNGDAATFTEHAGPVHLDAGTAMSIVDADGTKFDWLFTTDTSFFEGSLRVSITSGKVAAEDVLAIDTSGRISLSDGMNSDSMISVDGLEIATIVNDGAGINGNDIFLRFNLHIDQITSADVEALINAITYSNRSGNPSTADRSVTFTLFADNTNTTATTLVHVAAVNDAPVAAVPATHYQATEQTTLDLKNTGLHVSDVDSSIATVTLSVDSGILHATAGSTAVGIAGDGTSTLTLTGTFADINALLNTDATSTVSYINAGDAPPASVSLSLAVSDGSLSGSAVATIDITPTNDAPADVVPPAQTVLENLSLVFSAVQGNAISVSDIDAGSGIETVTLLVQHGILTLGSTAGLQSFTDNASTVVLSGTIAQLNAALEGTTYTPAAGYSGPDQLSVTIDDNGSTGSPSNPLTHSDTVALTVIQVPEVQVFANHATLLAGQSAGMTFLFSEPVANFALADVAVSGGTLSDLVHVGTDDFDRDIYGAIFTPDASNVLAGSVQVRDGSYTDASGTSGTASNIVNFTGDTRAPAAPALALHQDTGVSGTDGITSNPLIDTIKSDPAGTLLYKADGAPSFSATVPAFSGDGQHTLSVVEVDAAGNVGPPSSLTFTLDTTAPTVSMTADHSALLPGQTALVTFDFSEAIAGFALSDIQMDGGALSGLHHVGLNGAGHDIYTAVFTPQVAASLADTMLVSASSYTDIAGNLGAGSTPIVITGHTSLPAAPGMVLDWDSGPSAADHITRDPVIDYTRSSPAQTLYYAADGAGFSTAVPGFATDGSQDGTHTVSAVEVDAAGNVGPVSSLTFTLDTTAPHLAGVTASPAGGSAITGSTVQLTLGFNEAVTVVGGTPTLTLNDGGNAIYDAAATALLGDPSKLVFDHIVSAANQTSALGVTGFSTNGADIYDLAGNHPDLSNVSAVFSALQINETSTPAYAAGGITRPELHFDPTGHIILDAAASAFAGQYGIQMLYLGLPPGTPYPPVPDLHV
ncbi:carboxypeptidase regulatory-like domain-containing protein [Bradyrhizobium tropiciagri]|uniref:SdrD B-like domain-containing protein n=1 Tax=Bradyrhizobium tropiciagri TaxID=312253 RepID=UPI001BA7AFDE|nr:SdrD B-like domain-containing protein [Bradyrhizobium tropiciagri]MBR0870796.1 carboxypeptidase regulatory-like domain-containing protein [Bradyrhizobium tropiciagri]